jgi:hypothetical protein
MKRAHRLCLAPLALALLLLAAPQGATAAERYRGTLVDLGQVVPGTSTTFQISLERLTTPERLAQLAAVQKEDGLRALQETLYDDEELGYIRVGEELGYPVSLALTEDGEQGRVIYAVVDRPIQAFEVWQGMRTRDYPFSVVELRLDEAGRGTGKLYAVAKVWLTNGRLRFENWQPVPFRLVQVGPSS